MFKVECPGCKAPYQVDERRVPSTGLKMRCPKCGTSFHVDPPDDGRRTGPSPVLGESLPQASPAQGGPPRPPPRQHLAAKTIVGVAPSSLGVPVPPPKGPPPVPPRAAPPAPAAPAAVTPAADPYAGADLPAVGAKKGPPPVPARAKPAQPPPARPPAAAPQAAGPSAELDDLPAAVTRGARVDVDLPALAPSPAAPRAASVGAPRSDDLPAVRGQAPAARGGAQELDWDLPTVGGAGLPARAPSASPVEATGFELDLPDLSADLPATATSDLPLATSGRTGLPVAAAGLPVVSGSGLPMNAAGLPMNAAGLPMNAGGLPVARVSASAGFGELDLEPPGPRMPSGAPGSFGEIDLPPAASRPPGAASRAPDADPLEADPFGEAALPPPVSRASAAAASQPPGVESVIRSGGGGTSYGEVNLDGGGPGASVPLEEPAIRSAAARGEEDMEFGAVPQERVELGPTAMHTKLVAHEPKRRSRAPLRVFAALFLVAVGGGSLTFVPSVGPYGAYWIGDRLNASEHQRLLDASIVDSRRDMGRDSYPEARGAFEHFDAARASAKRVRAFNTYLAFLGYLRELRFGNDPAVHARAQVLLADLGDARDVPYLDIARAARSVVEDPPDRARGAVAGVVSSHSRDVDALVLSAELELRARDPKAALLAWQRVGELEKSARAAFGLARAEYAGGDSTGAQASAEQALALNPAHVGAKILVARLTASSREREAEAMRLLEAVTKDGPASQDEVVLAETLLGDIHLQRSRISLAEAAYGRALKLSPGAPRALSGIGEALFRSGRYAEALARFEAGNQADPSDPALEVGVAKSRLMLERIEDATRSLTALMQARPDDAAVALWYGRALEASGARDRATGVYRAAIAKAPVGQELVDVYIALAMLLSQDGQAEEAQKLLASAQERLPESASLRRAIGEVALGQGRHADAIAEFRRALALDKDDLAARFRLGVALRRNQNYDEAGKVFDEVGAVDKDHPGLALERGLLFEATGHSEEALKAYEGALAKAPGDADLMLRVGCGNVAAGRLGPAEELLRKVLALRQNSAEANHCLGRALLEGGKFADAQRLLDRALELDPHRAEYHLYVGWAAAEKGDLARAEHELAEALKIDGTLADAYWQRGVLRARQGAARDAVGDFTRALELNPGRHEVHAALADAYYDLGRERDALGEWQKAVAGKPDNALWRFRYGKLLVVNQLNDAGRTELLKAIDWAEKQESPPRWLWEAHHLCARSFGARPEAAHHWEQFLRLGPRDSPYRAEAKQALARLGKPWSGE